MSVQEDGTGDVLCGPYDDSIVTNVTDDDNVDWTEITTTDVYTGDECNTSKHYTGTGRTSSYSTAGISQPGTECGFTKDR